METTNQGTITITEFGVLLEEYEKETPRAAVILAVSFFDNALHDYIESYFVDDQKVVDELLGSEDGGDKPLAAFSSRIKLAYCIGLISKEEYKDLNLLRKLRNKFAHNGPGITLNDDQFVSWINDFELVKEFAKGIMDQEIKDKTFASIDRKLKMEILLLGSRIWSRAEYQKRNNTVRRPILIDEGFRWGKL